MTRRAGLLLVAALLAGHEVAAQADSGAARPSVLVRAGRLIAVRTGTVLTNQAILIEGDRIKEVGPADAVAGHAPRDARVIDLRNATVLPGLIDCHTHITSDPGDYYKQLFRMSPIDEAVRAHIFAKRTLDAGFTTVRNVGAGEFIDVALRNAINEGAIPGPCMLVSTMPLSATGGHGTYLVADIYNDDYIIAEYTRLGFPQKIIEKERLVGRQQRENFKKAVQAGGKNSLGTDAGVYPHGWNAKQFAHMVRWGTTSLQAIQAATVNAAGLIGWGGKRGGAPGGTS